MAMLSNDTGAQYPQSSEGALLNLMVSLANAGGHRQVEDSRPSRDAECQIQEMIQRCERFTSEASLDGPLSIVGRYPGSDGPTVLRLGRQVPDPGPRPHSADGARWLVPPV